MKDTGAHPIPVKFKMLGGGTSATAVANLVSALTPLIAPHLVAGTDRFTGGQTIETAQKPATHAPGEDAIRDAQGAIDAGGFSGASAYLAATTYTRAQWEEQKAAKASRLEETPAEDQGGEENQGGEQTSKNNISKNPPAVPSGEGADETREVREILVPVEAGADLVAARASLIRRISGPLPARTAVIMQTSGSTVASGHLVALSIQSLVASARSTLAELSGPGRWILALPVNHIAGFQVVVRSILGGMAPIIVETTQGFRPENLVRAVERATSNPQVPAYISLVPTQLSKVLDEGGPAVAALARLDAVLIGGAAATAYLLDRARAAGMNVVTTYGSTETCGGCVYDGIPIAGVQVATIGSQIWVSGTVLMEGYLEKPEPGEEAPFVDMGMRRWLRTADTGRMEGPRLVIQGRADDVINTGGVKVHASAVEQASAAVPGVGEVCVLGLPDARWGEAVTAVVVPAADAPVSDLAPMLGASGQDPMADNDSLAARIRTTVGAELGTAHAPRIIVVVPFMPKLNSGKTDRREVATLAQRELRAGRAWIR